MGWKPEWDVESIMSFGQYHDDRTVFRGVEKVSVIVQLARKILALTASPGIFSFALGII